MYAYFICDTLLLTKNKRDYDLTGASLTGD